MRTILLTVLVMIFLSGCSSAAANTQAQAELERQRQLAAQAEADAQRQADMIAMMQAQALANQQAQAAAAQAQAQAQAALAQAGQAQAAALDAVANSSANGVRLPTSVALALIGAIVVIALGFVVTRNRSGAVYEPPPVQTVRLLPNPADPLFNQLLTDQGGYWRNGRAYTPDGVTVVALLAVKDEETQSWTN